MIGVELFMPVMRPDSCLKVLRDLNKQTLIPKRVTLVNNCCETILYEEYRFELEIINPGRNIGTNAVWNLMWKSKCEYVGMVGDDLGLEPNNIELLVLAHSNPANIRIGASTCMIFTDKPIDISSERRENQYAGAVVGKGHFGLALFKIKILKKLPPIPSELFLFFGDNWLWFWLNENDLVLYEISSGVSHQHKTDLKDKVGYKKLLKRERAVWEEWKRFGILSKEKRRTA